MKILASLLILSLASCGSIGSNAPNAMIAAEKGLTIAHLAYNAIGTSLIAAANSGALKGQSAATAKADFDKAGMFLDTADAADKALNAEGIVAAVTAAEDAIAQASAIVTPKK